MRLPVKEEPAGSIPAPGAVQRKGEPTGDGSRFENGRALSLEGSTPSPSASLLIRGSANGRPPGFEPDGGGSNPPPRTLDVGVVSNGLEAIDAPGQLLLVVTPRSERGGRWFDSSPRNSG